MKSGHWEGPRLRKEEADDGRRQIVNMCHFKQSMMKERGLLHLASSCWSCFFWLSFSLDLVIFAPVPRALSFCFIITQLVAETTAVKYDLLMLYFVVLYCMHQEKDHKAVHRAISSLAVMWLYQRAPEIIINITTDQYCLFFVTLTFPPFSSQLCTFSSYFSDSTDFPIVRPVLLWQCFSSSLCPLIGWPFVCWHYCLYCEQCAPTARQLLSDTVTEYVHWD